MPQFAHWCCWDFVALGAVTGNCLGKPLHRKYRLWIQKCYLNSMLVISSCHFINDLPLFVDLSCTEDRWENHLLVPDGPVPTLDGADMGTVCFKELGDVAGLLLGGSSLLLLACLLVICWLLLQCVWFIVLDWQRFFNSPSISTKPCLVDRNGENSPGKPPP